MNYDSKLFFGAELGKLEEVLNKLNNLYPNPPRKPDNLFDNVNWINTQLPDGVFLEVVYPRLDCEPEEMVAHLSLLDEDENLSVEDMREIIKNSNYMGYSYILGKLNIEFKEPLFYTKYYVYN